MSSSGVDLYTREICVKEEHIDDLRHVNNAVYIKWVQEIAGEHWRSKYGDQDLTKEYWMVLEHQIKYKKQAFLNDVIRVETYVTRPDGLRFPRVVQFYRDSDLLVECKTTWVWMDGHRNRPKTVTKDVLESFGLYSDDK